MANDITKRMRYFDRQFLRAKDFQDEQAYHIDRRRKQNKLLRSPGIVEGLEITGTANSTEVTVKPGVAMDNLGREIFLTAPVQLPLSGQADGSSKVYIEYGEKESDLKSEGGVEGYTRIEEISHIKCTEGDIPPEAVGLGVVTIKNGQLNAFDGSSRIQAAIKAGSGEWNSINGICLNAIDRPMITRGWNKFASGHYQGIGRWGMFMEPHVLSLGIPNLAGKSFKFRAFDDNSTGVDLLTISREGNVYIKGYLDAKINLKGRYILDCVPTGSVSVGDVVVIDVDSIKAHPLGDLSTIPIRTTRECSVQVCGVVVEATSPGTASIAIGGICLCNVIGPIDPGDLLTTSETGGYAKKRVLGPDALGAIVGKSLGSLAAAGKGKIPILVMLQ